MLMDPQYSSEAKESKLELYIKNSNDASNVNNIFKSGNTIKLKKLMISTPNSQSSGYRAPGLSINPAPVPTQVLVRCNAITTELRNVNEFLSIADD